MESFLSDYPFIRGASHSHTVRQYSTTLNKPYPCPNPLQGLRETSRRQTNKGFIGGIDVVVLCQSPRLSLFNKEVNMEELGKIVVWAVIGVFLYVFWYMTLTLLGRVL